MDSQLKQSTGSIVTCFSWCLCSECDVAQMKCKNGRCKPKFWACDGLDDCGDNSDEENCGESNCWINFRNTSSC